MCACGRGVCEPSASKYLIHWITDARMCCCRKCWAWLVIWIGVVVRNLCSKSATLYVVREAEVIDLSSQKSSCFDSLFACISAVCGNYLAKRWIEFERSRVGALGTFDA